MNQTVIDYLNGVQFLNTQTSSAMLGAELYLFFGGVFFAFVFGGFSLVLRATRAAGRDIDL